MREIWAFDNRSWLVITRTFFPRESLQIYRYKGLDILTDTNSGDANGAREVLTSPMYRKFLPLMKLENSLNILDLGANNGGFPLLLASSGFQLKKVVSVEFNPKTFIRLHFNLLRNVRGVAVPLNAALCGEDTMLNVSIGDGSVSDSIYEQNSELGAETYEIEGKSFDSLYNEHFNNETIDICKIDVEGAEFDVFRQPFHSAIVNCRYLLIEIHEHEGRDKNDVLSVIGNLGFVRQEIGTEGDPWVHFFVNSSFN